MFASNGEGLDDFDAFHPDRMASRILDMGDVLTLIEQAQKSFDTEASAKAAEKLLGGKGDFGLDDFLQQMQSVRKMGPLSKILGMMPGMGQMKDQIAGIDEREIDRIEAIIYSMTPAERSDPKVLNGSRRLRIANGSGTKVSDVNALVKRFTEAKKMMQMMAGGMPGMPGMPGMAGGGGGSAVGGGGKKRQARAAKKRKGPAGPPRPAARPELESAPASPFAAAAPAAMPEADVAQQMTDFQLPPELQQLFNPKNKGPS
jgi:signal recognition particle subunit SRP54